MQQKQLTNHSNGDAIFSFAMNDLKVLPKPSSTTNRQTNKYRTF